MKNMKKIGALLLALALSLGLSPFDLKLVTAVLLLIIIIAGGQNRKKGKRHA